MGSVRSPSWFGRARRLVSDQTLVTSVSTEAELGRADQLQPVMLLASIAIGLALAKIAPDLASSTGSLVSLGVLTLIYLVMLGVDLGGISSAFGQRRFLGVAIGINFVVNPLIAWGLGAVFLGNDPELWVGLILFLVTPCIGWYLIFTELAGGDATLGVSLLAINVVLQIVLLPAYLLLFAGRVLTVDVTTIAGSVILYLVLPLAAAALTRRYLSSRRPTTDKVIGFDLGPLKTISLMVVIVSMFASQGEVLFGNPNVVWKLAPAIALFFVIAFGIAVLGARLAGLPYDQAALLVFTTTSRNSEASLAIAVTAFSSPFVALTVVIGPVIELPLLVLMVRVLVALRPRYAPHPLYRNA